MFNLPAAPAPDAVPVCVAPPPPPGAVPAVPLDAEEAAPPLPP